MKTRGIGGIAPPFLTSGLYGGEWLESCPATGTHWIVCCMDPQSLFVFCEASAGNRTPTVQPNPSLYELSLRNIVLT
jgi:hypothetical protein